MKESSVNERPFVESKHRRDSKLFKCFSNNVTIRLILASINMLVLVKSKRCHVLLNRVLDLADYHIVIRCQHYRCELVVLSWRHAWSSNFDCKFMLSESESKDQTIVVVSASYYKTCLCIGESEVGELEISDSIDRFVLHSTCQ